MAPPVPDKYAFLRMSAPPGYVAGLGRGASGFTTRSDIGPAREGPSAEAVAAAREKRGEEGGGEEEATEQFQDPDNETGLFAGMVYEADDAEADRIYEQVDKQMEERRRARKEAKEKEETERLKAENPTIQERFSDLKRGLADVTDEQWETLPEVGNLTGKRRKLTAKNDYKSYAVSDSVLIGARDKNGMVSSLDPTTGLDTPADGTTTNFVEYGAARNKRLGLELDQVRDSASGSSTNIDAKGYLTELDSVVNKTDVQIGDTKRGRTLLSSLIKSNPKHAPGWIAAAQLEKLDGKIVAARKIIAEGCEQCPKNQDVWLKAADLNTPENAKVILASAIKHLPQSVEIWRRAAELEGNDIAKKRIILRKALEYVPNSVKLWRSIVSLEDNPEDARILLTRAVELNKYSVELWLALARVETPDKARAVLNKARKAIPTSHEIWIAASRLQEQEGSIDQVDALIVNAVASLRKNGAELSREEWLREAKKCEANGSIVTCQAIVKATIFLEIDEEDRLTTWLSDVEACEGDRLDGDDRDPANQPESWIAVRQNGHIETARAILSYTLTVFRNDRRAWKRAVDFEKAHGSRDALLGLLEQAVTECPHVETFWLMAAKEKWLGGDVEGARKILANAFDRTADSEQIFLAAAKLEIQNNEVTAAKQVMARARAESGSERIWMKSAVLERDHGSKDEALRLVNEGLTKYPAASKLYMIKGQLLEERDNIPAARETYANGTKKSPQSVPLWIMASRLEEKAKLGIKSRAIMERARMHNPKDSEIWMESIKLEERTGSTGQAKTMMARALQECPTSGLLWSESIWMENRPQRKSKSVDALKKTNNDPMVLNTVARLFWAERKIEKARDWFGRSVQFGADIGDSWAWWYKFEKQHGTPEHVEIVVTRCIQAEPHHGPIWQVVAKDPANARRDTKEILEIVAARLTRD